ncbi:MAG: hypothetical protein GY884_13655 [Proteobacteria bacterium]|nr:hypothetical protein [Pseudomonadota bacterium]
MLRYIHLNPCRAGLASDPLAWRWSTHRDLVGAVVDPWVPLDRWAEWTSMDAAELHSYIASDPSTDVTGTPMPEAAIPSPIATRPLGDIARASIEATRGTPEDLRRRTPTRHVFLHLAREQGWHDVGLLARACAMSKRGVLYNWSLPSRLDEGALCLGDSRLLRR